MNLISENETIKYCVKLDGATLSEHSDKMLAEQFLVSLLPEQRARAKVVPIMGNGKEILFD